MQNGQEHGDKQHFHKQHLPKQADYFIKPGQLLAIEQAASFSHFN